MQAFYQNLWEEVGDSLHKHTMKFINSGHLQEGFNDTLTIPIPKAKHPKSIFQFRPINLCNVRYKIITKPLVNRLKEILPFVVGLNQSSFVPRCQTTDTFIVYQEIVHSMKKLNIGKGIMLLKIDVEKVYMGSLEVNQKTLQPIKRNQAGRSDLFILICTLQGQASMLELEV